ncbi:MAG: hypothetical protein ACYTEQ_30435 [Planctomycetota bacterium]
MGGQRFDSTTDIIEQRQHRPAHTPRPSDAGLVFLFAFFALIVFLIFGALVSIVTGSLDPLKYAIIIGAVALVLVFFAGLWQYRQLIIWKTEDALQHDIDKDGPERARRGRTRSATAERRRQVDLVASFRAQHPKKEALVLPDSRVQVRRLDPRRVQRQRHQHERMAARP